MIDHEPDLREGDHVLFNIVDLRSSTIHRVVKGTSAAEAASTSMALDRQLSTHLLAEALLH